MLLLIDQGNTALKYCVRNNEQLLLSGRGSESDLLTAIQEKLPLITQVAISSVKRSEHSEKLVQFLNTSGLQVKTIVAKSKPAYKKLNNCYSEPTRLGVDRWLAMIALWEKTQKGFIIVDAGTALTLDIVDDAGQHLGGHIIPGLAMQSQSLLQNTDSVRFTQQDDYQAFVPGSSTAAAVHNGCLTSLCSYINAMSERNSAYPLFLTGGDAVILSSSLAIRHEILPDLVLEGLYNYALND